MRLRGALSRSSVERVLARAAALAALLFATQSIPSLLQSIGYLHTVFALVVSLTLFVLLVIVGVAVAMQRGVAVVMAVFANVFLVTLALWPLGVADTDLAAGDQPWLWFLIDIGITFVAIAYPTRWATAYSITVTVVYIVIRTQPSGGGASFGRALIDGLYVLLVGAFIVMIVATLRVAADRVDAAQQTAIREYERAARSHAAEAERLKVDALVHDTVLTALISAARGGSEVERHLTVELASTALQTLQQTPDAFASDTEVALSDLAGRLIDAARLLSPRITFSTDDADRRPVPGTVAEAVFSAAVQAMINSLQHAAAEPTVDIVRTLSVHTDGATGFTVQVSDTGVGFDLASVPPARLGLRVSIRERMLAVDGRARIRSTPGGGTSVIVSWRPAGPE